MACSRAGRKRYSSVALKNMVFRSRSASSMDIKRTMTKSERKQKKNEEGPSVKQLQNLCFTRRISEKGNKAALMARIEAHDRGEEEPGEECPICGNTHASEFYGGSSHDPRDASANHGHGNECQWCSGDHIMSRLSDGIPPEDIDCMWCKKPLTQADVRRQFSNNKLDYRV